MFPITDRQKEALKLWHSSGWKSRKWYKWNEDIKIKISKSHIEYNKAHKEERYERAKKITGENHYWWKWWITKIQVAIRTCGRNRNWIREIKKRDNNECRLCKSKDNLEVHHLLPIKELIEKYNIKSHKDTYIIDDFWNIENWITVCSKCHSLIDNKRKNGTKNNSNPIQ